MVQLVWKDGRQLNFTSVCDAEKVGHASERVYDNATHHWANVTLEYPDSSTDDFNIGVIQRTASETALKSRSISSEEKRPHSRPRYLHETTPQKRIAQRKLFRAWPGRKKGPPSHWIE